MPADTNHTIADQPVNRDISIWRYMDLPKFLALLSTRMLYFPRADLLGDKFEGSVSNINAKLYLERYHANPGNVASPDREIYRGLREYVYVSCWHMNESESAAMWSLYGGQKGAIAIRTTYSSLAEALPEDAILGKVTYADYQNHFIPEDFIETIYMHKRASFSHEREVRALLFNIPKGNSENSDLRTPIRSPGISIPVDLDTFIRTVYLSPEAPTWYEELLRDLLRRYGTSLDLLRSDLDDDPIFY
ncbi:MAG: DUF2971 domain-containing protein [Legionella sp.]|uniref:DUF2971 domain-containing protein n=1 Tax=Legionella sp. TaxID=459 RepID=UPI00284F59C9|nr:DUF2971 domain-containing protein [Legionella sp.]